MIRQNQEHRPNNLAQQPSASENMTVSYPGMNNVLESPQMYGQTWNPTMPSSTIGATHLTYRPTGSEFYQPATPADRYAGHFPDPYAANDEYRTPTNFTYVPGMPVHCNHYENISRFPENQWSSDATWKERGQPDLKWNERGQTYHHFRGNKKNSFQARGQSFKTTQSYASPSQENFYNRDDYYYETPHYPNYYPQPGRRGVNHRGREVYNNDNTYMRMGNGDGKHHRRQRDGLWLDEMDKPPGTSKSSQNRRGLGSGRYNSRQTKHVFDSHPGSSMIVQNDQEETQDMENTDSSQNVGQAHVLAAEELLADELSNYSRCGAILGQEFRGKEAIDTEMKKSSNKQGQVTHSRTRGQNTAYSAKKGVARIGHQSTAIKASRAGHRDHSTQENDENQRVTLTEQLSSSKYECMVCCDNIWQEAAVWSCQNCYHVFHLSCIQKWAQSSLCKDTKAWRCPGCQNVSTDIPSQYRCFCGRRRNPTYKRGETAHSCGETCRKIRKGTCRHPCTLLCHPGPCPVCCAMVWVTCDCGKVRKHVRCTAAVSVKCEQVCEKILNCGNHQCLEMCHSGTCPPCSEFITQECFCKKLTRKAICGTEEFKMVSFSCEKPCGRTLNCGNHVCEEVCHPGECGPCALMPTHLQSCCCGKTPLSQLDAADRQSCLDAVPTCGQICNKPMLCGSVADPHLCERACHPGDCGPCSRETHLKCQCGATEKKMACELAVTFDEDNPFKCQRRCGKKKICGRHKCSDNCCIKDVHICEIVCGRKLSCGLHKCEELCHRGNCKKCLQASFDELTCYCGAELIEPPVPCGTHPPECRRLCTRQHECDHPVRHYCHREDVCPPCTELTDKMCMGGHMVRKNVPCHMTNISCGYPCNRLLPCSEHQCQRICHRGDCLEEGTVCVQLCEKIRPACSHPCGAPCHPGPCPDMICKAEITITCPCGNRTAKAQCSVGGDHSAELAQFQRLSVQSIAESGSQGVDMAQFTQSQRSNKRLDCDTNCAIIERNRRLALALEIKNPDMNAKLGNPTFTDFLKDYARKNPKFVINVEKSLSDLVQSAKQSAQPNRSHAFQSMNREQRRFVHELAEFYGCQTQSYDYEPNKNVVATAVRDKCWLPNITLSLHVLKDQLPKVPPPISSFKTQGVTFTVLEKKKTGSKEVTKAWGEEEGAAGGASKQEPAVDYFDFTSI